MGNEKGRSEVAATVELTDGQKKVVSAKLTALRADFPVQALHLLMTDGSEWKIGEFPLPPEAMPKKKRKGRPEGELPGELIRILKPWIELAGESPGTVIKLRPFDLGHKDMRRMASALSAAAITRYGKGMSSVRVVHDDVEGEALLFVVHKEAHPRDYRKVPVAYQLEEQAAVNGAAGTTMEAALQEAKDRWVQERAPIKTNASYGAQTESKRNGN